MTHKSELEKLVNRMEGNGWTLIAREKEFTNEKGRILGDIDLLFYKDNFVGRNYVYFEEKGGSKAHLRKAKKQIARGMKYIIDTYNPHRLWGFYCHKQDNKLVEVYEQ